jgi:hypothetical protein
MRQRRLNRRHTVTDPLREIRELAIDRGRPHPVLAVTSGVSTESMRTGIRMFGVSPSVTSTSARAPSDGMFAPTGDQKTCTAPIIFTAPTSSTSPEDQSTTHDRRVFHGHLRDRVQPLVAAGRCGHLGRIYRHHRVQDERDAP